jgi:hypothetical protein
MAGFIPQEPPNPFGPTPQLSPVIPPAPVLPPSVFNQGTAGLPGLASGVLQQPAPQPETAPAPQSAPAPQIAPSPSMNIGGYRMPQIGTMADYTPANSGATDVSAQSRQPQMSPQQQQGGGGFLEALNENFQNMGNGGSLIGALTGQRPNNQTAQFLVSRGVDPALARTIVSDPSLLRSVLPLVMGQQKKYEFIKADDGSIIAGDQSSGKSSVSYGGSSANSAGVAGPDGKIIPYPEGLDTAGKKTFANEIARINADAASGKKTEVQAKSEKFGNRMELAEKNLRGLDTEGTSLTNRGLEALPGGVGNLAQSEKFQKFKQARSAFIQAMLRDESGAAIQTPEFARLEREMFPQPGDTRDVIAQKAGARKVAIEAMKKSAGPGYKSPESTPSGISRADIEAEIRRRGLMK